MTLILLLTCLTGFARAADPAPAEVLARAERGRVEFLRAVADVGRFAPRLSSKEKLFPYLLMLEGLEKAGRRYDLAGLGTDPVKDLGADLAREAEKWLRLDRDTPESVDAFIRWSANDTRITAAGDAAMLASDSAGPDELLAWNRGTLDALERLKSAKAQAPALQAFGELQGVITREILRRRKEFPAARLAEAVESATTVQGLGEVLAFLDLEAAAAREPAQRRELLGLALLVARGTRGLPPSAPLRLRAEAGALLAALAQRALAAGDELDAPSCRAVAAGLMPSQAEDLLASLGDMAGGAESVKTLAAALREASPHLAAARRRDFARIEAR